MASQFRVSREGAHQVFEECVDYGEWTRALCPTCQQPLHIAGSGSLNGRRLVELRCDEGHYYQHVQLQKTLRATSPNTINIDANDL